ncbi:hypothetical protein MU858_21415 [Bacillus sp. PGP15]|uniref:hypothetical protein n=1 Tax=Bacillus sp. PGP15 TaxID=2933563 RepID=UPI002000F8BF|nr:hypothetical protein [Bacillus sp. PGP15]UPL43277.1 hypothetical protein MU858_21415 [Bacillus sp. PGP15]
MTWIIVFLFGTSFGIFMSTFIDRFINKQFEKGQEQKGFKIEKITWLSNDDKERGGWN